MLFEDLYRSVDRHFGGDEIPPPLGEWAEGLPVVLDGSPFSFRGHEYLKQAYSDDSPEQVYMKAAQMGLTVCALLRAIYGAKYKGYRGVLYLFPSRSDVIDFSKARMTALLDDNESTFGKWIGSTDASNLKRVADCYIYFRGMRSRSGLKSIPVDFLIFDELDEGVPSAISMAEERLGHSTFKHTLKLSNPTLDDFGIAQEFAESDQHYWLLKCLNCGKHTCMEDCFPDCLKTVNGKVIRACQKCHAELNPSVGEWVAKRPTASKRGFHFSQLFSTYVTPASILKKFESAQDIGNFWNLVIGNPYTPTEDRLSVQEILGCCSDEAMWTYSEQSTVAGVDVGGRILHVTIGMNDWDRLRIVYVGEIPTFSELDKLFTRFHVSQGIIDSQPEQRAVREFCQSHRGIFGCHYSEHQRHEAMFDEKTLSVRTNRTEALDSLVQAIRNNQIALPKENHMVQKLAQHCHNSARKLEEDPETGSRKYRWIKLASGNDHLLHSLTYTLLAFRRMCDSPFSGTYLL